MACNLECHQRKMVVPSRRLLYNAFIDAVLRCRAVQFCMTSRLVLQVHAMVTQHSTPRLNSVRTIELGTNRLKSTRGGTRTLGSPHDRQKYPPFSTTSSSHQQREVARATSAETP